MTKIKKKHVRGLASAFLTQKQAMRRLQLSLPNFRRLCILKGIYPVEPSNRKKIGKGNSQPRIFYNTKDITFLAQEPLIEKFRKLRNYQLKLKKARERKDKDKEFRIRANKPRYTLHHLVKERYPSRRDALNDLSDSLNLIFLFSRLPRLSQFSPALIGLSRRLCVEFLNLIVATQAVRKAFISIKGYYIEADLDGTSVVWVIPHSSVTHSPTDVDYRILATCLEFDITLVGSVLCHLYRLHGLQYPPKLSVHYDPDPTNYYCGQSQSYFEMLAGLSYPLKRAEEKSDETEMQELQKLQELDDQVSQAVDKQMEINKIKTLFKGKRFFLMREVPREIICLIVRSCGGECSWDKTVGLGSTFSEDDASIDYQIVDRPMKDLKITRYYVQPQWVFDCLNARRLLPTQDYLPGVSLPAHLSPFLTTSGFNDLLNRAGESTSVSQRGGLVGVAPGFGEGAAAYRPPEADYFAGLVSLAELRGKSVQAQAARGQKAIEESGEEDENELSPDTRKTSYSSSQEKSRKSKKPTKADTPVVLPGRAKNNAADLMQAKAEANAERKLREMLLPKKQRNAYKKMVHSIKRKGKEARQLEEKRRAFDSKNIA